MNRIKIKINNKTISGEPEQTIFELAQKNKIIIPGLCHHPDFPVKANCRLCLVEIKDQAGLKTACSTAAEDGMEIFTDSPRVLKIRKLNLELIFAEHIEKCPSCIWRFECPLLRYARDYGVKITRFKDRKGARKTHKFANAVEIDGSQCIDCRNCLDACSLLQRIDYLALRGKGAEQEVVPVKDKQCILCGQCALHCPVSAAQEQAHWQLVEQELKNKNKAMVVQFAPSIRVSIGEDFGLPYGKIMTGQVVAALRRLGFDYVFDVSFGADITTMVEAAELLERLAPDNNRRGLPMFTSCCPGWVNYLEIYQPQLIPNLTTARSPHLHSAGVIKTYWAEKMNLKPKDITVVSVMPCTAKKYEAARPEMKIKGVKPVDLVITTRELVFLLKKNQIELAKLKPSQADNPLGQYSGAAVIYGSSGGVMESALRTAQFMACQRQSSGQRLTGNNKLCPVRLDFKAVRGLKGVKETTIPVAQSQVKVAVVNGIGNILETLDRLDQYDYVEVMACLGGCIGGGGQPIPTNQAIRQKRLEALYQLDQSKTVRKAHENKAVAEVLAWLKQSAKLEHQVLHTSYRKRKKY